MRAIAASLLLFAGAPLSAQTAEDQYRAGVEARLAGDSGRAAELLANVVAAEPDNSDAQLQLGLALLSLNRLDEAEAAFQRTLAIAPDYADARIGLARVAQRRGDTQRALAELEPVGVQNPEAAALRRQLIVTDTPVQYRWRLDLDGSFSRLTGAQEDWREAAARLTYHASTRTAVSGGVEFARRFGLNDLYGEFRLDRRLSDAASAYVRAGGTPNADFRPEWQVGAGGTFRVSQGAHATVLTIDATQAHYRAGDIQTLTPGIDQYLAGGRMWLGARWINIFDEDGGHESGWLGRADFQATPRLRLFAGAADAPDTSEGVVVGTFSLFGGLSYDASDRITLRASLAHEDRETGTDRLQFGLGAGWKF